MVVVTCCYAGAVEEAEEVVRPLRAFGSPVLDRCEPKPYVAHQAMFDPTFPHGWWYAEVGPGQAAAIPPGHDAETVGDEACVWVDFGEISEYAKR